MNILNSELIIAAVPYESTPLQKAYSARRAVSALLKIMPRLEVRKYTQTDEGRRARRDESTRAPCKEESRRKAVAGGRGATSKSCSVASDVMERETI